MIRRFASTISALLCGTGACSVCVLACVNSQQPILFAPAAESAVVPQAVSAPAPLLTIAVAASAEAPEASAARSEFEADGLIVPRAKNAQTQRVHQIAAPAAPKRKWSVRVGRTTFRTTMAQVGDAIVIGTHGATLNGKAEPSDGVYVIDARTGKQRTLIRTPGTGDLDVGGIAIEGRNVYFTADNSQVVAATLEGRVQWSAKAKGKVRPAPALADLDGDGQVDVVVGDEQGELFALDGKNGQRMWTVQTGENDNSARGFLGAAAIADLDGDGRDDVVAGARDGIMAGYRGRDGAPLWQVGGDSGIHAAPVIADLDQDGKPEILAAWSYGTLAVIDGRTGRKRWSQVVAQDSGGIEGLFGTPVAMGGTPGVLVVPTAWWGKEDGIVGVGMLERAFKTFEGRVSSSAVVTDLDGDGVREAIVGTERGTVVVLHADGGYASWMGGHGAIEATPMLADVDGNGTWELLVASNDGQLTCYETGSRAKPDVARFRGESLRNRGDLGAVRMGWRRSGERGPALAAPAHSGPQPRIDYLSCCQALQDEATRAPVPRNARYLQAALVCLSGAKDGKDRVEALRNVAAALGGDPVPRACR